MPQKNKIEKLDCHIEHATVLLKALSNHNRLTLLYAIDKEEKCVGDLEKISGLSQSALSQHLALLRQDGFVKTRREGQTIYYSIKCECAQSVMQVLSECFPNND